MKGRRKGKKLEKKYKKYAMLIAITGLRLPGVCSV